MNVRGMSTAALTRVTQNEAPYGSAIGKVIAKELARRFDVWVKKYRHYRKMMRRINPNWGGEAI